MNYKPIETEKVWTGDGLGAAGAVILKQVKREGMIAIYSRTPKNNRTNLKPTYEVIKIHRHNGYELGGQKIEPAETYPGASQWGKAGWDCVNWDRALEKFNELVAEEKKKAQEEAEAAAKGIVLKRRGRPKKVK